MTADLASYLFVIGGTTTYESRYIDTFTITKGDLTGHLSVFWCSTNRSGSYFYALRPTVHIYAYLASSDGICTLLPCSNQNPTYKTCLSLFVRRIIFQRNLFIISIVKFNLLISMQNCSSNFRVKRIKDKSRITTSYLN